MEACYRLGKHHEDGERYDRALDLYKEVVRRNPQHKYALGGIHQLSSQKDSVPKSNGRKVKGRHQQGDQKQLPTKSKASTARRSLEAIMFAEAGQESAVEVGENGELSITLPSEVDRNDIRNPKTQCVFGEELLRDGLAELAKGNEDAAQDWFEKAVDLFETSANAGHAQAQYQLGECFRQGYGVEWDERVAVDWYKRAAKSRHRDAQYQLGECYFWGRGVRKKLGTAEAWYLLAAEQGHEGARQQLKEHFSLDVDAVGPKKDASSSPSVNVSSSFFQVLSVQNTQGQASSNQTPQTKVMLGVKSLSKNSNPPPNGQSSSTRSLPELPQQRTSQTK